MSDSEFFPGLEPTPEEVKLAEQLSKYRRDEGMLLLNIRQLHDTLQDEPQQAARQALGSTLAMLLSRLETNRVSQGYLERELEKLRATRDSYWGAFSDLSLDSLEL